MRTFWKHLNKKDRKHLRWANVHNIAGWDRLRTFQQDQAEKEDRPLVMICSECNDIERKVSA